MANLAQTMKNEIARIAKRETKTIVEPIRKTNAQLRSTIAELKRTLAAQARELAGLRREMGKTKPTKDEQQGETTTRHRISAQGVKSLREKLGLTAEQLAGLVGVSGQSIYLWEQGKTSPRAKPLAALVKLRPLGKKDAKALIEELSARASMGGAKVKKKVAKTGVAKKAAVKKTAVKKASAKEAPAAKKRATKAAKQPARKTIARRGGVKPAPAKKAVSRKPRAKKAAVGAPTAPSLPVAAEQQAVSSQS